MMEIHNKDGVVVCVPKSREKKFRNSDNGLDRNLLFPNGNPPSGFSSVETEEAFSAAHDEKTFT